ncbi:MAG: STAS domain-containing protein [Phycisphaerae bacterium]
MRMDVDERGDWVVLVLTGELTHQVDDEFAARVAGLVDAGKRQIALDLQALNYLSSAGLGALVRVTAMVNSQSGRVVIVNPSLFVAEILRTTKLDQFFEVAASVDAIAR